jgi:hypothetical protein
MKSLRAWTWLLATLALGLLAAAPASAQRGGDEGEYQILQARYGTAQRNVDVTDRLKELARRDRAFRMGNDTFGVDPHPNSVKVLRIYTRDRRGNERMFEFVEGSVVDGAQFTGWGGGNWGQGGWNGGWGGGAGPGSGPGDGRPQPGGGRDEDEGNYQILQARYGTAQRNVDVTERLKELARRDRVFRMGNDTFGVDPHPQHVKTLRIFTRARDGQQRSFEYVEGSLVDGRLFTGWAGGGWGQGGWAGGWGDNYHPGNNQNGYDPAGGRGHLAIVSASYGAGDRQRDITYRLRARVRDDRLDVRADNELAGGDPAPETTKQLWVTYTVGGGREQRVRVAENERIRLP